MRVLIVEDDARLAQTLRRGLQEEGFAVDVVDDGRDAIAAAKATPFDAISLDVMLPGGLDGFAICAEMRRLKIKTAVLMLTARDAVSDRVRGLESGADDYLIKPFAFVEFLARIRALARRHLDDRSARLELENVVVDTSSRELRVDGEVIRLTTKEYALLEFLAHHPRRVLSRQEIEEHVWSYDFEGGSNLVDVYVGRLRRQLKEAGARARITTLRGVGFRFDPVA